MTARSSRKCTIFENWNNKPCRMGRMGRMSNSFRSMEHPSLSYLPVVHYGRGHTKRYVCIKTPKKKHFIPTKDDNRFMCLIFLVRAWKLSKLSPHPSSLPPWRLEMFHFLFPSCLSKDVMKHFHQKWIDQSLDSWDWSYLCTIPTVTAPFGDFLPTNKQRKFLRLPPRFEWIDDGLIRVFCWRSFYVSLVPQTRVAAFHPPSSFQT